MFQASMLEAMKNLRDEMLSFHQKASESGVDKTSDSAQAKAMPGTSTQPDPPTQTSNPTPSNLYSDHHSDVQPMDLEPYGPPLPPKSSQPQSEHASKHSDLTTRNVVPIRSTIRYVQNTRSIQIRGNTSQNPATFLSHRQGKMSPLPMAKHLQKPQHKNAPETQPQASTDPVFYREVDMSDLPSQYTEEVETFRQILDLPDPRETLPRSSTTVLGLDDKKGQQELRPRGPSAMLPLNPILKDTKISWPLIYPRVNISNPQLLLPSTTRWDS